MEGREKIKGHLIVGVTADSPSDNAGVLKGDRLVGINKNPIEDILDFRFFEAEEELTLTVQREGRLIDLKICKDEDDELGLCFENSLMDEYKSCRNKCIFCFIDQNPHNMRDTVYFKDDDSRLSFLQGNYVTLTNLNDNDIDRICRYRLSPVNISVHTTNPELRCKMLNNRFAGESLRHLKTLKNAGIAMSGQIVLCKGYNDGEELERTIHDLTEYIPCMESLSVVPVGLTKHRDGLAALEPFSADDAERVLETVRKWQKICMEHFGTRFVFASDEWYITAGLELPEGDEYEDFAQLENGVGMMRCLVDEVHDELKHRDGDDRERHVSIATGALAAPYIKELCGEVTKLYPNVRADVHTVRNDFFGERITVAGLLTGSDIIGQLKDVPLGSHLLLPSNLLRAGEDVLLDDVTVGDIENALQTPVRIVQLNGWSFVEMIID